MCQFHTVDNEPQLWIEPFFILPQNNRSKSDDTKYTDEKKNEKITFYRLSLLLFLYHFFPTSKNIFFGIKIFSSLKAYEKKIQSKNDVRKID